MTSIALGQHDSLTSSAAGRLARAILSTDRSFSLTVLRITLGLVMLPHGLQKTVGLFGGYGFSGTMSYFISTGIPAVFAFLAIAAESAGALGLLTGTTTRIAAFGVGIEMVVASTMHLQNGFFMNWFGNQKGEGIEYHIFAITIAAILVVRGGGRFSLDRLFTRTR
ncbi:MAG: DoxX family protein [Acidobacteriota bacterium]|nr:DoxX family protein [Acidobacteriota bacterium]